MASVLESTAALIRALHSGLSRVEALSIKSAASLAFFTGMRARVDLLGQKVSTTQLVLRIS